MKIWTSDYQLYPKSRRSLSELTEDQKNTRRGTLLKIQFDDGSIGYSDLCPFIAFGDYGLEKELEAVSLGGTTKLSKKSLYYAQADAKARSQKISLYSQEKIKSHYLVTDLLEADLKDLRQKAQQGYSEFKFKIGKDEGREILLETEMLRAIHETLLEVSPSIRLRLDFNASLMAYSFVSWLKRVKDWLLPSIEFIEDPFLFDVEKWSEIQKTYGVQLAMDFEGDPCAVPNNPFVVVLKPARDDVKRIVENENNKQAKFVVTHYMDFPIGQMTAYFEAQKLKNQLGSRVLTGGLQSVDIYETFIFQNRIEYDGPFLTPPAGIGFGFDELLERQEWTLYK